MLDPTTVGYSLEGLLVLAGLFVLIRGGLQLKKHPAGAIRRLPQRNAFVADLLFFLLAILVPGVLSQLAAVLGRKLMPEADTGHLTLYATFVLEFGMIGAIAVYYLSGWQRAAERPPATRFATEVAPAPPPLLAPLPAVSTGVLTFLGALPIVYLVSALWQGLLDLCGYPVAHQNIVEVFLGFDTPVMKILFVIVAAVLVPFNEEMIFRGGLFRGLLASVPRRWAIGISAVVFAAVHLDVTSLVPLAVLGAILALAYERTGNIRTVIIAHALFNLNTLVALMLGVNQ